MIGAKPSQLVLNVRFLELFATKDEMKGETGYAFTLFSSSLQFLKYLDLNPNLEKQGLEQPLHSGLSISDAELLQGLEKWRVKTTHDPSSYEEFNSAKSVLHTRGPFFLSPVALREARSRGECINLQWARKWEGLQRQTSVLSLPGDESRQGLSEVPPSLPDNFSRAYSYLATDAKDIKLSDIPALLKEYEMLVYATEALLAERTSTMNRVRKQEADQRRAALELAVSCANIDYL